MNFNAKILINSYLTFNIQNKIKEQSQSLCELFTQTFIEEGDVIILTIRYGTDREPLNENKMKFSVPSYE